MVKAPGNIWGIWQGPHLIEAMLFGRKSIKFGAKQNQIQITYK